MASLLITTGEQAGRHFHVANRPLSVGRDPARDIQLTDPKVSRKHFLIRRQGANYALVPFPSTNGVLVGGVAVAEAVVLRDGDTIEVGDTALCFSHSDVPDRTNALLQRKRADRNLREFRTLNERG